MHEVLEFLLYDYLIRFCSFNESFPIGVCNVLGRLLKDYNIILKAYFKNLSDCFTNNKEELIYFNYLSSYFILFITLVI